jgi:hypothetical protein
MEMIRGKTMAKDFKLRNVYGVVIYFSPTSAKTALNARMVTNPSTPRLGPDPSLTRLMADPSPTRLVTDPSPNRTSN